MISTYSFIENRIFKVTPGKLSRYFDRDTDADTRKVTKSVTSTLSAPLNLVPGRLKLYIRLVKVSKSCMKYLRKQCKGDIFINLKWLFFDFHEQITSPEKLEINKTYFDFTTKYTLEIGPDFLKKLKDSPLTFELYSVCGRKETFLSSAKHYFNNIFEMLNNKQETRVLFTNDAIDPSGETIAYLDVWYKFSCKQRTLKLLLAHAKIHVKEEESVNRLSILLKSNFKNRQNLGTVQVTDSEVDHFADGLLLVLNRNKVLKTTQSDISLELEQRVRWLRFEANWKQTLQENAILHGKDPRDVVWRQWREEDTANVRLRTYHDQAPKTYKPELTISVKKLIFFEGSAPIQNDAIKQIYVEYSFLHFDGPEMESPVSVKKGKAQEEIIFNFKKRFNIDVQRNYDMCVALCGEIKRDGKIKFMVISEPIEDQTHIQACEEIGYAEVQLCELIQLEENEDTFEYEIVDINNPIAVIGYLTVKIGGILALRKMALLTMAPKGYNLYM